MVGLIVYREALPAGQISEPSVSVPMDIGEKPAETATADPDEDPDGFYFGVSIVRELDMREILRCVHLFRHRNEFRRERKRIAPDRRHPTSH